MQHSKPSLNELQQRKKLFGSLGALDYLIQREKGRAAEQPAREQKPNEKGSRPKAFLSEPIELEPSWVEKYSQCPQELVKLSPIKKPDGLGNDYRFMLRECSDQEPQPCITICILTYNRDKYLERTLAAICKQDYPPNKIEVVVSDDGSPGNKTLEVCRSFSDRLNIKYAWHPDSGFRAARARNNAISLASHDTIILLDVDMLPSKQLVSSYARHASNLGQCVLIGPRKYVDASRISGQDIIASTDFENLLVETNTNNTVADFRDNGKSIDWRLPVFEKTNNLITEKLPYRVFASGNVCFSRQEFYAVGRFDERFVSWGYEDTELGFRFYNNGKYFIPILEALAFHQEPPGGENETNREEGKKKSGELFGSLCPHYRKLSSLKQGEHEVPLVSIYIPAYNCKDTICDAIDSVLRQTYKDIETCICDDGSTDGTAEIVRKHYLSNSRVRLISQKNAGIGAASNTAVRMCKGLFIGQLDSDDILADDAVEICVEKLESDPSLGLVYTSYFNWDQNSNKIADGYNYPIFSREKALTAMIFHHFRMFRRQYWYRTDGFNEHILNAVDYDMYLKLMEKSEVHHINRRAYLRRLHGGNTSIINYKQQMLNTATVVNQSLQRHGIPCQAELENPDKPKLRFSPLA